MLRDGSNWKWLPLVRCIMNVTYRTIVLYYVKKINLYIKIITPKCKCLTAERRPFLGGIHRLDCNSSRRSITIRITVTIRTFSIVQVPFSCVLSPLADSVTQISKCTLALKTSDKVHDQDLEPADVK